MFSGTNVVLTRFDGRLSEPRSMPNMTRATTAVLLALSAALAGCSTVGGSATAVGAFAAAGGAERPISTAIVDSMAGGLIGTAGAEALDQRDRRLALEAEYRTLEYTPAGQVVAWGRQGDSRYGQVTAGSPYRVGSQDCRQYSHTVFVTGQSRELRGTACRNPDGSWTPLI